MKDFFISYQSADRNWAVWIAWQLEEYGYKTVLQDWDFRPGENFVLGMDHATKNTKRTIAVLSPDYIVSLYTQAEWATAFVDDPTGQVGKLLPIRVRECELKGLLSSIIYIDLVGLREKAARDTLLTGVRKGRVKPNAPPAFPERERPPFPGGKDIDYSYLRFQYCYPLLAIRSRQFGTGFGRWRFMGLASLWLLGDFWFTCGKDPPSTVLRRGPINHIHFMALVWRLCY